MITESFHLDRIRNATRSHLAAASRTWSFRSRSSVRGDDRYVITRFALLFFYPSKPPVAVACVVCCGSQFRLLDHRRRSAESRQ